MLVEIETLVGARFGSMTVLDFDSAGIDGVRWRCMCDCGEEVVLASHKLEKRSRLDCSRHQAEKSKHRLHPLYERWKSMRARCANEKNPNYGGKGVFVCQEWDDFKVFCSDMGPCPAPGYQIDRIDSDGPYSKSNCRWLSAGDNSRTKNATLLNDRSAGEVKTLLAANLSTSEIADAYGVSRDCVVDIRRGRTWRHVAGPGANCATH